MQNIDKDRERAAYDLAERLFFELERHGEYFSLRRKIGDHARRDQLTISEVEQELERWKLEGPHGG